MTIAAPALCRCQNQPGQPCSDPMHERSLRYIDSMSAEEILSAFQWANWAAEGSLCTRRKVGAVLLDPSHALRSVGINHIPGQEEESCYGHCPRSRLSYSDAPAFVGYSDPVTKCHAVHAEIDALEGFEDVDLTGWAIVVTCQPCPGCEATLRMRSVVAFW